MCRSMFYFHCSGRALSARRHIAHGLLVPKIPYLCSGKLKFVANLPRTPICGKDGFVVFLVRKTKKQNFREHRMYHHISSKGCIANRCWEIALPAPLSHCPVRLVVDGKRRHLLVVVYETLYSRAGTTKRSGSYCRYATPPLSHHCAKETKRRDPHPRAD